jgi:hypothetical protein
MGNGLLAAGSDCGVDFDPDVAEVVVVAELWDFAVFAGVEAVDGDDCFCEFAEGASGGGGFWLLCCPSAPMLPNSSNQATNMGTKRRVSSEHSILTILDVLLPKWIGEMTPAAKNSH